MLAFSIDVLRTLVSYKLHGYLSYAGSILQRPSINSIDECMHTCTVNLPLKTAFSGPKRWSLVTGFTVHRVYETICVIVADHIDWLPLDTGDVVAGCFHSFDSVPAVQTLHVSYSSVYAIQTYSPACTYT